MGKCNDDDPICTIKGTNVCCFDCDDYVSCGYVCDFCNEETENYCEQYVEIN